MSPKKTGWLDKFDNHPGVVDPSENVFANVLRSPSPSLNSIFGKAWGIPWGYSMLLWGPQKSGKSTIIKAMTKQIHEDDPEAVVLVYNTEMRHRAQWTAAEMRRWGIDPERVRGFETNDPKEIFDHFQDEVYPQVQQGMPLRMVAIDSMSDIRGLQQLDSDTVTDQQRADQARTIKAGLQRIKALQRRGRIPMVMTCQVSQEMDPYLASKGVKYRMNAAHYIQHYAEYFVFTDMNKSKDGSEDLLGNKFVHEDQKDADGNPLITGHKIRVSMKASSLGPRGRAGEFTYDYARGIVNIHEEVLLLGVGRGIIARPNNTAYELDGKRWNGKAAMLNALKEDPTLQRQVLRQLMEQDASEVVSLPPEDVE